MVYVPQWIVGVCIILQDVAILTSARVTWHSAVSSCDVWASRWAEMMTRRRCCSMSYLQWRRHVTPRTVRVHVLVLIRFVVPSRRHSPSSRLYCSPVRSSFSSCLLSSPSSIHSTWWSRSAPKAVITPAVRPLQRPPDIQRIITTDVMHVQRVTLWTLWNAFSPYVYWIFDPAGLLGEGRCFHTNTA